MSSANATPGRPPAQIEFDDAELLEMGAEVAEPGSDGKRRRPIVRVPSDQVAHKAAAKKPPPPESPTDAAVERAFDGADKGTPRDGVEADGRASHAPGASSLSTSDSTRPDHPAAAARRPSAIADDDGIEPEESASPEDDAPSIELVDDTARHATSQGEPERAQSGHHNPFDSLDDDATAITVRPMPPGRAPSTAPAESARALGDAAPAPGRETSSLALSTTAPHPIIQVPATGTPGAAATSAPSASAVGGRDGASPGGLDGARDGAAESPFAAVAAAAARAAAAAATGAPVNGAAPVVGVEGEITGRIEEDDEPVIGAAGARVAALSPLVAAGSAPSVLTPAPPLPPSVTGAAPANGTATPVTAPPAAAQDGALSARGVSPAGSAPAASAPSVADFSSARSDEPTPQGAPRRRTRAIEDGAVLSSAPAPDSSGPTVAVAPVTSGEVAAGKTALVEVGGAMGRGDDAEELHFDEIEEVRAPAPPPVPGAGAPPVPPSPPISVVLPANGASAATAGAAPAIPPPVPPDRRKRRAKQWFEEVFDEDYLRTLPYLTPPQTEREADFIVEALGLRGNGAILDVGCGYGRHTMELAGRGYEMTGLDLSLPLLIRAADAARRVGLNINFVHGDMREMAFNEEFDAAYCFFTTFGYFDDETNRKVTSLLARALRPGGRLLLDIINRDYIVGDLPARVWWQGEGCMVLEEVSFNYFTSRIQVQRSTVFEDGRQAEQEISIRAYSLHEIGKVLHHAGFRVIEVSGGLALKGRFFGSDSRQILIVAEKKREG